MTPLAVHDTNAADGVFFYSPGDLCAEPSVGPDADLPEKYGKKRKICIDIKLYIWYIMEYKRAVLQNRNYV